MEFSNHKRKKRKIKSLVIIGGRPQIIKAMPLFANSGANKDIELILVNTGQHYSRELMDDFFDELNLPRAKYNLNCSKDTPCRQIAKIISRLEKVLDKEAPDSAIIFGDMNTTLAAAITCSKKGLPIIHVEAGTRSGNLAMSEEINRILADQLSQILLAPDKEAFNNLKTEIKKSKGEPTKIILSGDIMLEALNYIRQQGLIKKQNIPPSTNLLTLHRFENVMNKKRLKKILDFVFSFEEEVIFPAHPRTHKMIRFYKIKLPKKVQLSGPVGYIKILNLINNSKLVFTDSGGLQKETCWLGKPCMILRDETEKPEIIREHQAVFFNNYQKNFIFNSNKNLRCAKTSRYVFDSIRILGKKTNNEK